LQHGKLLPLMRGFVILVSFSLLACVLWLVTSARLARLEEASRASESLTTALAQHARDTLRIVDTNLLGLVERLEVDGTVAGQLPRVQRLMEQRSQEIPGLQSLFVFGRKGDVLASSYGVLVSYDALERRYFRWHLAHKTQEVHIGAPIRGKFSEQWVIPVSRRFNDDNGDFAGIVMGSLRVDYFREIYQNLGIGHQGTVSLWRTDGILLAHQPDTHARQDMAQTALRAGTGRGSFILPQQDGDKLYSYQKLTRYPLMVMSGLSQAEVLENWRSETFWQLLFAVVLMLLFNLFGFYLNRLMKNELDTRAALQQARDRLAEQSAQLEQLALKDELTGLANRRHFMACLREEVLRATRRQETLSLLLVDVDFFKQYNDLNGHVEGDECLRKIANVLLHGQKRPGDLAARYGGEEFCLLLGSPTESHGAKKVAEQIRGMLEQMAIHHAGSPLGVITISIGIHSLLPQAGNVQAAIETLLQSADSALYRAKAAGRNCAVVYADEH